MAGPTNLLELLGLTDPGAAILAAATGGSVAPPLAPEAARTGAALAGGGGGSQQQASVAQVLGLQRKGALAGLTAQQLKALEGALNRQGQAREAGGAAQIGAKLLAKFGGQVIGTGHHDAGDPGHAGNYEVVLRDGKLWHVYSDGTKEKLSGKDSGVARALGPLHAAGGITRSGAAAGNPFGQFSAGRGNGTGGALAPGGPANVPSSRLNAGMVDPRTGGAPGPGARVEAGRVPVDPLTGGAIAPSEDGTSQAAAATRGDVPMTGAEAYRRRLMRAHALLGLHP